MHGTCRGSIEVQPFSGTVRCLGCEKRWQIWESDFLCPCGASFSASEIEDALGQMLDYCRQLVYELSVTAEARERRESLGRDSMRMFLTSIMSGLGKIVGVAIESVLRYFFPKL